MQCYGTVANYLVTSILEGAVRLGAQRELLLNQAGIVEPELHHETGRQSGQTVLALWQAVQRQLNCPLVPFKIGVQSTRLHRSAITSLVEACETLGEALALGMRYQHITQDMVRAETLFKGDFGILRMNVIGSDCEALRPQIERQIAFIIGIASNLSPEGIDYHSGAIAELVYSPHLPVGDYEHILGIPVRFNQSFNQIVFPKAVMQYRNFSASKEVRSCLLPLVKQQAREMVCGQGVKAQVRNAIVELMADSQHSEYSEIEAIAKRLKMSVRTLQRRLKESNTSFSEIYDTERKQQALRWMQRQHLSLDEISYNLGFSHITGFYAAFQRWTGEPPSQYRKSHRPENV